MLDTNKFRSENNSPVLITQWHDEETLFILTWKQDSELRCESSQKSIKNYKFHADNAEACTQSKRRTRKI